MPDTSTALSTLLIFALIFGLRHGLDSDHLAAIDGLARAQATHGRIRVARRSGLLFSAGHGVVLLIVALICHVIGAPPLPAWLEMLGGWISFSFLIVVATANFQQAFAPGSSGSYSNLRTGRLLQYVVPLGSFGSIVVGALFALSFDALSLAIWFFWAGSTHGSIVATLLLVGTFALGMVITDTANGWFVSSLIGRSEHFVDQARRLFALLLSLTGFVVALLGLARMRIARIDEWLESNGLWVGVSVVALSLFAYMLAASRSASVNHAASLK